MSEPNAERRIADLQLEIRRLRNLLRLQAGEDTAAPPDQPVLSVLHPGEVTMASSERDKLALFGSLFNCRRDVYARRWDDGRQTKGNWSPATEGYWRKGVPMFQQRLLPLTAQVVKRHLSGEIFIGLYPLLADGTCWWMACDFDGRDAAKRGVLASADGV